MAGLTKGYLRTEQGKTISFMFNPSELSYSKQNSWTHRKSKGKNTGKLRFEQGQPASMSMSLVFDTTADGKPVTDYTDRLLELMTVDEGLKGANKSNNKTRPPWFEFGWGSYHSFKAILENLELRFTYFNGEGVPLRAHATLSLKEYEDSKDKPPQNPTSGTPEPHTVHRLLPGETLDRVAAEIYGRPSHWRTIAEANGIIDPLELVPGTPLVIPEPEVVSRA